MANYPNSLDDFANPQPSSSRLDPSHSLQHADANDAIEAIEAKLGTGASDASAAPAGAVMQADGAGASAWATSLADHIDDDDAHTSAAELTAHLNDVDDPHAAAGYLVAGDEVAGLSFTADPDTDIAVGITVADGTEEAVAIINATAGSLWTLRSEDAGSLLLRWQQGLAFREVLRVHDDGDLEVLDAGNGLILKATNGSRWRVTVANDGALVTTEVV